MSAEGGGNEPLQDEVNQSAARIATELDGHDHQQQQQQQRSPNRRQDSTNITSTTDTTAVGGEPASIEINAAAPLNNNNLNRRGGRVHWDAAPHRRVQGQQGGATVTVRSPPSQVGVQRAQHPGPLGLTARLGSSTSTNQVLGAASEALQGYTSEAAPDQSQVKPQVIIPTLSLAGAKGLDEQGLDNRAFLELQRELQRHEASEVDVDDLRENQDRATEIDHSGMAARNEKRRRQGRPETPDWSSGAATPVTDATSESGSYDPHNDSDLDHIDLMPGEVDGLPARLKKKKGEEEEVTRPSGWSRLRNILVKTQDDNQEDAMEAQREKTYEEGGPTNLKSVPVTTSSGVRPGGPRSRPTKYEKEASRLVKAHRLMSGQSASQEDGLRLSGMPTMRRDHLESGASTPDRLDTQANLSARPVATGGILGNLLKLYEQQQREERARQKSGYSSEATSPLSTPAVEMRQKEEANLSNLVSAELQRESMMGRDLAAPSRSVASSATTPRRKSWAPGSSPGGWKDVIDAPVKIAGASKKVLTVAAKEAGFEEAVDERPKASRSSAGVIGGLIATTGNLIGAVSPHHAQLGPNPKRPGYTLDRYLLPEMNAKTLKKTAQIVADAAPRPYRSQPGTPGRTSGYQSPQNIDRKDTNDSGETQAVTPSTVEKSATRPSSIINGRTGLHSRKNSNMPLHTNHLHLPHMGMGNIARSFTGHSAVNTPDVSKDHGNDYFGGATDEQAQKAEWQRKLKKRAKDKAKREEIFITMHVAAILQRQEFVLKLARALMMFGAPTHRIETQIQQTARVLEINCRCIYLPNLMLLAFGDDATHTSETKFIKQGGGLNLTKLTDMHAIYWNVIHDKIGVGEASKQLDELMRRKPLIGKFPMVIIGGLCSAFICPGSMGFNGSFIDALAAIPLGMFLVFCQLSITTELFSNVFEILFAAVNSFVAAALASTGYFCYAGVISGSIVLILPGFIVLSGALELQSKNLVAGSVRLVYAIIYSLFLGFGISIGSSFWLLFSGSNSNAYTAAQCINLQDGKPWWRGHVPLAYAFLTVPGYSISLALRNQAKITRKEFPAMVAIAIAGWATNHFSSTSAALSARSDVTSALGAMCVGLLSNIFGRIYDGQSYTVATVGVLYQLPSGLSNSNGGTLLNFASTSNSSSSFNSGFQVAENLVEVAIGLTVGLYAATVLAYLFGGRKVRGGGLFSF